MKIITLKLLFILSISLLINSCTSDENGIYMENDVDLHDISLTYSTMEYEILDLINDHRNSVGLSSLNTINLISEQAIEHTNYMIDKSEASHDNFAARNQNLMQSVSAKIVGENVAYGYRSADAVVNSWIKSDGHRRNLENPEFTDFGVSTKQDKSGRYYFTHIFVKI